MPDAAREFDQIIDYLNRRTGADMTIAGWEPDDIVAFGALTMSIHKAHEVTDVFQQYGDDGIYENWIDVTVMGRTIRLIAVPLSQVAEADRDDLIKLLQELGGTP